MIIDSLIERIHVHISKKYFQKKTGQTLDDKQLFSKSRFQQIKFQQKANRQAPTSVQNQATHPQKIASISKNQQLKRTEELFKYKISEVRRR